MNTDARFRAEDLVEFATRVLGEQGVRADEARITAQRLVEADIRGRSGHGLIRLPLYSKRIQAGGYNLEPEIEIVNETPVSALVDGDNGLGQVVMTRAAEIAIGKANAAGIGWVATVHSNHAGAAGVYPAMALEHGLGAMYYAIANGNGMPPWGGREKLLGTNPMAVAVPAGTEVPFQLDIATTVASHGTIKVAAQRGESMPPGWVIDIDGNPITDPNRAEEGFLVPIGGYKGAGLNFMIGILSGIMTGAAFGRDVVGFRDDHETPTNTGQSMIVFRPDLFIDMNEFAERMDAVLTDFRTSESMTSEPIRLPGDGAAERIEESGRIGVLVPGSLRDQLDQLALSVGAPVLG
jgi:LDH2 family malate/lactate/ureidoglycolate dehydrogenase